ncbi:MAG: hypothetical protein AB9869_17875 [Verrucomicrobiia bacterium]
MSGTTIRGPIPRHILDKISAEQRAPLGKAGRTLAEIEDKNRAEREKVIQKEITNLLRLRKIVFNVSRMDRRKTDTVGWPDFTFAVHTPGMRWAVAVALEVKAPGGKPSAAQQDMLDQLTADGWYAQVVYSVEDVRQILAFLRHKTTLQTP